MAKTKIALEVQRAVEQQFSKDPLPSKMKTNKQIIADLRVKFLDLMSQGLEHQAHLQSQYFGVTALKHDFDDIKE